MGDNNYPTYEQRELGPLEAARRELQRQVAAGRISKKEMWRQHRRNKIRYRGWGETGYTPPTWEEIDEIIARRKRG